MAFDTVIDKAQLEAAMKATADAIREKTGDTANCTWDPAQGFAALIAAIEAGGGVDVSWFEGMGFEEGSITFATDTSTGNAIATSFTQCYGGIVIAESTSRFTYPHMNLGCYQADAKTEHRYCVGGGDYSYYGVNTALDGYYGAKYIYLAFGQYSLKFKAGVTYKYVAWGV